MKLTMILVLWFFTTRDLDPVSRQVCSFRPSALGRALRRMLSLLDSQCLDFGRYQYRRFLVEFGKLPDVYRIMNFCTFLIVPVWHASAAYPARGILILDFAL